MKRVKMTKRLLSFFIILTLIFSMAEMSVSAAFAASSGSISYDFTNAKAGYAEGTVTLRLDSSTYGNYFLYWADSQQALDGYYYIAELNAQQPETTYTFLENIAIPPDATKIIAFKSDAEPAAKLTADADFVYDIPSSKINKNSSADKSLSFEALSDTQLDQQSSVFYTYSMQHFAKALEDAADRDVDFITMSGDCVNNYENGTSKEWQAHQKLIADSSFTGPIYETNGNHSMKSDIKYGIQAYIQATGLGVGTEALGDKPYYEMTADNGDHFIFVALEGSSSVPTTDEFSMEQLDWLEATIQKYYNDDHHIFVFEHAFFHGWGPGDDKNMHYYSGGLRTTSDFPGNKRFLEIMNTYTEVFLYTGHSHLDFMYNWNYDNENGQTANMFHIPSTACATHVTDGKLDYSMYENSSQCYIVESYNDAVISYGLDVVENRIYPAYTYIVETDGYSHVPVTQPETEPTTESSTLIDVQVENATSYLYSDGAALFFYNNDSGNYYSVDRQTGIAQIPENAVNLTLYRCKGSWNSGQETKNDGITSYYNKYGPCDRTIGQQTFYVAGSSNFRWTDNSIVYPETTAPTESSEATTVSTEPVEPSEVTVYWAIPSGYTDSDYSYKMNLRCSDGSYPHSVRVMKDTGKTYQGMKVYSYTFSADYTAEYDKLGINRIQLQCINNETSKSVFQYALQDTTYTVSMLKDMIFVSPSEAPTGTVTADFSGWEAYGSDAPPATEPAETTEPVEPSEVTVYWAIPSGYTDSDYSYKMNLRCSDGSYPHSARVMKDTGKTYQGMKVYSYTFSADYTAEYDKLGINRIQLQCINNETSKSVFQYALQDTTYTVSMLKDMIFVSTSEAPTGTVTADFSGWKAYDPNAEPVTLPEETTFTEETTNPENTVEITLIDSTSTGWLYTSGAAVFIYDNDTGEHYAVSNDKAVVPADTKHITVYRCNSGWGVGNATDSVTTYWNKWTPAERTDDYDILSLNDSGKSNWMSSENYEPEKDAKYYLVGYFNNEDYLEKTYQFDDNGKLNMVFNEDSYVYIVSSANSTYWTNGWLGNDITSATLYRAQSLSDPDKLYVQSGKIEFTLTVNDDGTLSLSYTCLPVDLDRSEIEIIKNINTIIGDTNGSGGVEIIDATLVQRYLAKLTDDLDLYAADVFGNGNITIMNATMIQKYIAGLITQFPASDDYVPDTSTLENLAKAASDTLYTDYRYASYTAYSRLKKAYFGVKDISLDTLSDDERDAVYSEMLSAYNDFSEMKENNNIVTVYFCNDDSWSNVRAYCTNSSTNEEINSYSEAQPITRIKTLDSGVKIYCITLNQSKWDKIIFMNSTDENAKRTVELDVPSKNYLGYYFSDGTVNSETGYYEPAMFRYCYDRI